MVTSVRAAVARTVLTIVVAVAAPVGLAQAAGSNPTGSQIKSAIKRAESSKTLWATVNVCNSKRYPDTLGVRGQMPSLGFASWLSLYIQVNYFSKATQRFEPSPHATKLIRLGRTAAGLEQGGYTFSFQPKDGGLFNAKIDFIWRRSGKLLGQTMRRTTAGHPAADFGSPPRYSAKQCTIP